MSSTIEMIQYIRDYNIYINTLLRLITVFAAQTRYPSSYNNVVTKNIMGRLTFRIKYKEISIYLINIGQTNTTYLFSNNDVSNFVHKLYGCHKETEYETHDKDNEGAD